MKRLFAYLVIIIMAVFNTLAKNDFHHPDKVYLHLDRNLYAQGDTIWIKGYALQRGSHKPSNKSYAMHIQMLDEEGKEVHNYKLLTVGGVAQGQIEISSVMSPGFYQLIAHTGYMKNFDQRFFYKTYIEVRKPSRHSTINVQFDKEAYNVGDEAQVTFKMLDKNKVPISKGRFVCDFIQPSEDVERRLLRCYEDGSIKMSFGIKSGSYAELPKFKLSYFEKPSDEHRLTQEVYVPMFNDELDLQFYPEGGDLIQGISSKLAFKVTDIKGSPIDASVDIYDGDVKVCSASTLHQGMGICMLTPQQTNYTARVTSPSGIDKIYELPKVKEKGYTLSYRQQTEETVLLSLKQNVSEQVNCQLWISYCDSLWSVKSLIADRQSTIKVSKNELPQGIVTFTVSDADHIPRTERLVYVDGTDANLSLNINNTSLKPRQKVSLSLAIDAPKQASLSFTVVDSILANSPNLRGVNIKAFAELDSELQGRIINPNQYLGNTSSITNKRDLLLMTHGWRRFEWMDNQQSLRQMKVHDFNRVVGQVTRLKQPYANAKISAYMLGNASMYSEFEADEDGRFYIDPSYVSRNDQNILIMSRSKRGNKGVTLRLANTDTLLFGKVLSENKNNLLPVLQHNDFTVQDGKTTRVEQPFMMYQSVLLKEFEVSARKQDYGMNDFFNIAKDVALGKDLEESVSFYWTLNQFTNRIYESENPDIDNRMSRIRIITDDCMDRRDMIYLPSGGCISVYQNDLDLIFDEINTPAAMIYINKKPWGYETAPLDYLKPSDIASIAILDGAEGYNYFGIEAYYGAILVETFDKNIVDQHQLHNSHAIFGNFVRARQFASPQYDTEQQVKTAGDDNRVTLHWEPLLETDKNGKAQVSFYTGDIPGKKQIIVQGFDDEGNLYYHEASFTVKDILKR